MNRRGFFGRLIAAAAAPVAIRVAESGVWAREESVPVAPPAAPVVEQPARVAAYGPDVERLYARDYTWDSTSLARTGHLSTSRLLTWRHIALSNCSTGVFYVVDEG